jgi:hypothetical protein
MENSGQCVMHRKVEPRPVSASASVYDRFACAPRSVPGSTKVGRVAAK